MKKSFIGFMAVLFVVSMVAVAMLYAGAIKAPEKALVFENKKGAVTFEHKTHLKAVPKCQQCHHMWKDTSKPPQGCKECHKPKKNGDVPRIYKMAHVSNHSCRGCHKALKKAGKKTGPTKCSGCHKK